MKQKPGDDSLSVREWLALYTDRDPPLPGDLLDRKVNATPRATLRPAVEWLRRIGVSDSPVVTVGSGRYRKSLSRP